jgi:hypothetical protein
MGEGEYGVTVRVRPVFEGSVTVLTEMAVSVTVDTIVFARVRLGLVQGCTFDKWIGVCFDDGGSRRHCLLRFNNIEYSLSIFQQNRPDTSTHPAVRNRTTPY